jgi:hypothetical protein
MTQPEKKKRRILLIELPNFKETVEQWLTSIQSETSQKKLDALKGMINDAEMRILLGRYEDSLLIYEKGSQRLRQYNKYISPLKKRRKNPYY